MAIVDQAGLTTWVPNQNREVNEIRGVARIRVSDPLQETHAPLVRVISSMVGVGDKSLAHLIWDDHRHTTRSQVLECGLHHGAQFCLGRHVADGVVNEDSIENPAKPDGAYVPLDVVAFGVERLTDGEHSRGLIHKRHCEARLEVGGVVADARPELEYVAWCGFTSLGERATEESCFFPVLLGGREDRVPLGQLAVELHCMYTLLLMA